MAVCCPRGWSQPFNQVGIGGTAAPHAALGITCPCTIYPSLTAAMLASSAARLRSWSAPLRPTEATRGCKPSTLVLGAGGLRPPAALAAVPAAAVAPPAACVRCASRAPPSLWAAVESLRGFMGSAMSRAACRKARWRVEGRRASGLRAGLEAMGVERMSREANLEDRV